MREDLVSVVVPCHMQAHFLPEAVASLIAQTHKQLEIIFVCGDDVSGQAADSIKDNLPFPSQAVKGALYRRADAVNRGVALAQGEYICCLDADDKFSPNAIQRMLDATPIDAELAITSLSMQRFGASGFVDTPGWVAPRYSIDAIRRMNCLLTSSLFTKKLWSLVGGFPSELFGFEDYAFWVACSRFNPIVTQVPERLFLYRTHAAQGSHFCIQNQWLLEAMIRTINPLIYGSPANRDLETIKEASKEAAECIRQHAVWFPENANAQMLAALLRK